MCFKISINGFVGVFAAFCENAAVAAVEAEGKIITAGEIATSLILGCSVLSLPMPQSVNPHEGKTINRKPDAGDPPVRFGDRAAFNLAYSLSLWHHV